MADERIEDITAGAIAVLAAGDLFVALDVSNTAEDANGTTSNVAASVIAAYINGQLTSGSANQVLVDDGDGTFSSSAMEITNDGTFDYLNFPGTGQLFQNATNGNMFLQSVFANSSIRINANGTGSVYTDSLFDPRGNVKFNLMTLSPLSGETGAHFSQTNDNGAGYVQISGGDSLGPFASILELHGLGTASVSGSNQEYLEISGNTAGHTITSVAAGTGTARQITIGGANVALGNFLFDFDQSVGVGQDNYVLTYDDQTKLISLEASAGGGSPGGASGDVQYNDGASGFAAESAFNYDATNNKLTITGAGDAPQLVLNANSGIGSTTAILDVQKNGVSQWWVEGAGNLRLRTGNAIRGATGGFFYIDGDGSLSSGSSTLSLRAGTINLGTDGSGATVNIGALTMTKPSAVDAVGEAFFTIASGSGTSSGLRLDHTDIVGGKHWFFETGRGTVSSLEWYNFTDDAGLANPRMTLSAGGDLWVRQDLTVAGDFNHDGSNVGFFGTTPAAQQTGYTTFTNLATDRTCDADSTSVAELADILGTLIEDLKTLGLISA